MADFVDAQIENCDACCTALDIKFAKPRHGIQIGEGKLTASVCKDCVISGVGLLDLMGIKKVKSLLLLGQIVEDINLKLKVSSLIDKLEGLEKNDSSAEPTASDSTPSTV